MAKVTLVK